MNYTVKELLKQKKANVGDVLEFCLFYREQPCRRVEVEATVVKQESDGIIFVLKDCLDISEAIDYGDGELIDSRFNGKLENETLERFAHSYLHRKLNTETVNLFPPYLLMKMVKFNSKIGWLRVPTLQEITGNNPSEGIEQWKPMKDSNNRIAKIKTIHGMYPTDYWLQNKVDSSENRYLTINTSGDLESDYLGDGYLKYGVRIVFKLKL